MILRILPKKRTARVVANLLGLGKIQLWEYIDTRRKLKLKDLAVSQPAYKQLVPYPKFGESTCYIVPAKEWLVDDADECQLLIRILEHETIHDILTKDQMFLASSMFDNLFNIESGHPIAPSDFHTGLRF